MLLALWSLGAWALHAVAVWTVSNAGALSGAGSGVMGFRLPETLTAWLPTETVQWLNQLLSGVGPMVDRLLQGAPALADGVTVASWVVWGVGCALLAIVGAGLHALVAMWRRASASGRGGPALAGS
jgi:hypothetical protein